MSLVPESVTDERVSTVETNWHSRNLSSDQEDIEDIVSNILSSKFSEVPLWFQAFSSFQEMGSQVSSCYIGIAKYFYSF